MTDSVFSIIGVALLAIVYIMYSVCTYLMRTSGATTSSPAILTTVSSISQQNNASTSQITTIYTQEFSSHNQYRIPSYTEVITEDLPTYEEAVNRSKDYVR